MIRLLSILVAAAFLVATAADARDKRSKSRQSDDDDDDEGSWEDVDQKPEGPVTVKVPKTFLGKGYRLRIDNGEEVDLDKEKLTLQAEERRERLDVVDSSGRILRSERAYIDENLFDHFDDPRQFHLGFFFGGTTTNGKALRKLLQDSHFSESSLDFLWQPSAMGMMVSLVGQRNEMDHDFGVTSTYVSSQTRLGATYEFAPFKHGGGRRFHFLAYAGLLAGHHQITLDDDEVSIEDKDDTAGAFFGLDTQYPIVDIWLSLKAYMSYQSLEFKEFEFKTHFVQRGLLFGGYYAF